MAATLVGDHVVLTCLVDHLSLGDIFRLRRALGRDMDGCEAVVAAVVMRLRLSPRRSTTLSALSARMAASRRCRECGVGCRRRCRVCEACSAAAGYFQMVDRQQILRVHRRWRLAASVRELWARALVPVARSRTGKYLYWRIHVSRRLPPEAAWEA